MIRLAGRKIYGFLALLQEKSKALAAQQIP